MEVPASSLKKEGGIKSEIEVIEHRGRSNRETGTFNKVKKGHEVFHKVGEKKRSFYSR